ncbi:MAG: MFS transporter, partial [Acidimicrobiia bacterium]|nr:MFS transporter [Acidimicrobiia bacterium]
MQRNVGLVIGARLISRIGGEAAFFVGLWGKAAFVLGATTWQMTGLMAALSLSSLVGSAIAGVLVDRFDPRRVLIASEVLFVPATLAMIAADTIPSLIGWTVFFGLAGAPTFTAIASFAPYLTNDDKRLTSINSSIEAAGMAAVFLGPAAGALAVGWFSVDAVFVFDAITSLIAVAMVVPVRLRTVERTERSSVLREARVGLSFTYGHRALRFFVAGTSIIWLVFGAFSVLEPFFFRDVLGTSLEAVGWVASLFGLGLFAGSLSLRRLPAGLVSARGMAGVLAVNGL